MTDKLLLKLLFTNRRIIRRDTSERWEEYNPIIAENTVALVIDSECEIEGVKIGIGKDYKETPFVWEESSESIINTDDEIIEIEGHKFRRGDIYEIYECERDKKMFLNREAGFIVRTFGDKDHKPRLFKYGEPIAYESYPHEVSAKKHKWKVRMDNAIKLWKNK